MNKGELRKLYLEKRLALSDQDCVAFSERIRDRFFQSYDFSSVHVLHTFITIQRNKEPNTWLIIEQVKKQFPKMRISIPKVSAGMTVLQNYFLDDTTQLAYNKWGISEPVQGIPTPVNSIDIVLVPLLAFDLRGFRVGYGKGFYDKFLSECRPDCKKIGLSFFPAVDSIDDVEVHDKKLDAVITPEKVFTSVV